MCSPYFSCLSAKAFSSRSVGGGRVGRTPVPLDFGGESFQISLEVGPIRVSGGLGPGLFTLHRLLVLTPVHLYSSRACYPLGGVHETIKVLELTKAMAVRLTDLAFQDFAILQSFKQRPVCEGQIAFLFLFCFICNLI